MCLLVVHDTTCRMDWEQIQEAWSNNPDGGGFMYFDHEGQIQTYKTMVLADFVREYEAAVDEHPDSSFVVHFRFATSGATDTSNVHPFRIADNLYMAHNGVLGIRENKDADWSDTRTFAEWWLATLPDGWLDNEVICRFAEEFIRGSKLAFLTNDPNLSHSVQNGGKGYYILNEEDGHWGKDDQEGMWFSNYSYKYGRTTRTTGIYTWSAEEKRMVKVDSVPVTSTATTSSAQAAAEVFLSNEEKICDWCGYDIKNGDCTHCEWCYDCEASYDPEDRMMACICRRVLPATEEETEAENYARAAEAIIAEAQAMLEEAEHAESNE